MITYISAHRGTTREAQTPEEDPSHFYGVVSKTVC